MGWTIEQIDVNNKMGLDYIDNLRPVNIKI